MRLNALWWWIDRWRKSTAFMDMTLEEQGAYRNLLDEATLRGGALPPDERILAKACGDALAWPRVRATVLARFKTQDDGLLHNETLSEVLSESKRRSEKQADYRSRRGNPDGNCNSNGSGNPKVPPDPGPSPSPFQDPERTPPFPPAVAGGDEPEPTPATPEEARALALSVLGPKADPLTEREIKTMVSEAARFGAEQRTPLYRRERRRVRDWILAHVPLDEVKRRIAEGWLLQ